VPAPPRRYHDDVISNRIPNLAEYASGLEPAHVDSGPLKIVLRLQGMNATVTVAYQRLAVLSDIQFSWQTSTNLLDWMPTTPTQQQLGAGRDP
jgi:hypothetical protein